MENQVYVAMRYDIRGIYGNVTYCTNLIPIEEFNSDKYTESNITEENDGLIFKAMFSVKVRRTDSMEDIFEKWDIKGLPKCLGMDMNMYYKMSQLERIDSLRDSYWKKSRSIEDSIDKLTLMIDKKISEADMLIKDEAEDSYIPANKKAKEIMEKIETYRDKANKRNIKEIIKEVVNEDFVKDLFKNINLPELKEKR